MIPLAHVALLFAALALTVWAVARHRSRPTPRRVLSVVPALLVPACSAAAGLHRCDSGAPLTQWLVPGLALLVVLLAVEPLRLRIGLGLALAVLSLALSFHYAGVVHGPTYIGNPESFTLEGERADRRWHTPLTGLYVRVPDPTRRGRRDQAPAIPAPAVPSVSESRP